MHQLDASSKDECQMPLKPSKNERDYQPSISTQHLCRDQEVEKIRHISQATLKPLLSVEVLLAVGKAAHISKSCFFDLPLPGMSTHHCPMCEQADIALSSPCLLHGSWYSLVHTLKYPKRKGREVTKMLYRDIISVYFRVQHLPAAFLIFPFL